MALLDRSHISLNYGHILYRFRIKARYWLKNANSLVFNLHDPLETIRIFAQDFNTNCPSPGVILGCAKYCRKVQVFCLECNNGTDDRQTDSLCHKPNVT